jgi:hypothetical protein
MKSVILTASELRTLIRDVVSGLLTDSQNELDARLDAITRQAPVLDALGRVLIRSKTATERAGLHPTTLSKNKKTEKFEQVGSTRTYIELGELAVVQKRRSRRAPRK